MKRISEKALAMLLVLVMALGLTACGGSKNEQPAQDNTPAATDSETGEKTFTPSGKTLNVGVQSNIISIPTYYA